MVCLTKGSTQKQLHPLVAFEGGNCRTSCTGHNYFRDRVTFIIGETEASGDLWPLKIHTLDTISIRHCRCIEGLGAVQSSPTKAVVRPVSHLRFRLTVSSISSSREPLVAPPVSISSSSQHLKQAYALSWYANTGHKASFPPWCASFMAVSIPE